MLITSFLQGGTIPEGLIGPQVLFFVVNCIRSASTQRQIVVARSLKRQLNMWLALCQAQTDHSLARVRSIFVKRQLLEVTRTLSNITATSPQETPEDTAYWFGNGLVVASYAHSGGFPRLLAGTVYGEGSSLNLLIRSAIVRQSIVEALKVIEECLHHRAKQIDEQLGKFWSLRDAEGMPAALAQALNLIILQYHCSSLEDPSFVVNDAPRSSATSTYRQQLKQQALVALPSLMMHSLRQPHMLQSLHSAVQRIHQALGLELGSVGYTEFIHLFLEHTIPRPAERCEIVPQDRLVDTAAMLAGVSLNLSGTQTTASAGSPGLRRAPVAEMTLGDMITGLDWSLSNQLQISRTNATGMPLSDRPIARSYTSSMSSGFRSFKSARLQDNVSVSNLSMRTRATSSRASEHMSWSFSVVTGLPSDPSERGSTSTETVLDEMYEMEE